MYIHKGKTNTKQNENSDNMGVRLGTLGIVSCLVSLIVPNMGARLGTLGIVSCLVSLIVHKM